MSGAVVAIAEAMSPRLAHAGLWGCYAILAAAKALGPRWPRAGLALLCVGAQCSRVARGMLPPR